MEFIIKFHHFSSLDDDIKELNDDIINSFEVFFKYLQKQNSQFYLYNLRSLLS